MHVVSPQLELKLRTLFVLNFSYISFLMGMLLADKTAISIKNVDKTNDQSLKRSLDFPYALVMAIILGLVINTLSFFYPTSIVLNPKIKLLANSILNYTLYFLVLFILIYDDFKFFKFYEKTIIIFLSFFFIFSKTIIGVKSGIIQIVLLLFIVDLVCSKNFRLSKKILIGFTFLLPLIFLSYLFGLSIRVSLSSGYLAGNLSLFDVYYNAFQVLSNDSFDLIGVFESLFKRVSLINQIDILINKEINLISWIKNYYHYFVNLIFPGSPFEQALPPTLLFKTVFKDVHYIDAKTNYISEMLPLYGEAFAIFGPFGFIIIFFVGYFFVYFLNLLICYNILPNLVLYSLSIFNLYHLIIGMGILSLLEQILYQIIIPGSFLYLFFNKTYKKLKYKRIISYNNE